MKPARRLCLGIMLTAGCASLPGGFQTSAFPGDQEESYFIPDFGPVVGFGFVKRPVWTNIELGWFFTENMPYPQGAFGLGFVF